MKTLGHIIVYVLCATLFVMLGFSIFLVVSDFARDVLRIHETMNRGIYSTIQAILTIAIWGGSFLIAVPMKRSLMKYLRSHLNIGIRNE